MEGHVARATEATPCVKQDHGQMVAGKAGKDGPLLLSA